MISSFFFLLSVFTVSYLMFVVIMKTITAVSNKHPYNAMFEILVICTGVTYNCWYLFVKGL
jgi:hypothetical protein